MKFASYRKKEMDLLRNDAFLTKAVKRRSFSSCHVTCDAVRWVICASVCRTASARQRSSSHLPSSTSGRVASIDADRQISSASTRDVSAPHWPPLVKRKCGSRRTYGTPSAFTWMSRCSAIGCRCTTTASASEPCFAACANTVVYTTSPITFACNLSVNRSESWLAWLACARHKPASPFLAFVPSIRSDASDRCVFWGEQQQKTNPKRSRRELIMSSGYRSSRTKKRTHAINKIRSEFLLLKIGLSCVANHSCVSILLIQHQHRVTEHWRLNDRLGLRDFVRSCHTPGRWPFGCRWYTSVLVRSLSKSSTIYFMNQVFKDTNIFRLEKFPF